MSSKIREEEERGKCLVCLMAPYDDVLGTWALPLAPGSEMMKPWLWLLAVLVGMAGSRSFGQQAETLLPERTVASLTDHTGGVLFVAFSPDGADPRPGIG